jgi:hypothetical protein
MQTRASLVLLAVASTVMSGIAQNTFPSTGNVGIGTTAPTSILDIQAGASQNGFALEINNNNAYDVMRWVTPTHIYQATVGGSTTGELADSWYVYDQTTPTVRFLINPSGNVGLGTATPATGLDVSNGIIHEGGLVNPTTTLQGAYLGWNSTNGQGETDFINNPGTGVGGWYFISVPTAGSPQTDVLKISSGGAVTFADGTVQATAWNGVLCGGDYAESVDATDGHAHLEPGDVMVVDSESPGGFMKSTQPYSTLVAGIYSTKPGIVGRRSSDPDKVKDQIPMAMVGIVPAKVSAENGAVRPGDLLVTSSIPGYVMKGNDRERMMGAIVGKALGKLDSGTGIIDVLVSLQ